MMSFTLSLIGLAVIIVIAFLIGFIVAVFVAKKNPSIVFENAEKLEKFYREYIEKNQK